MARRLRLVGSDPIPRGDDLLEAWVRAVVQWQVVGLYLCAAWLDLVEHQLLGRSEP
jgi:hypothetical protein